MEATKRVEKPVEGEDEGFMAQFKKSYAAARDGKPLEDTPSTASPIETETGKAGRGTLGTRIFWGIAAVGLVMVIVEKLSSSGLDPAATLISRLGYENLDPKVEMVQHIASCKIEGQPAEYAIVQLSINYLNLGGTNSRHDDGKTHVIVRKTAKGDVMNAIAPDNQPEQVASLRQRWTEFWGCKL